MCRPLATLLRTGLVTAALFQHCISTEYHCLPMAHVSGLLQGAEQQPQAERHTASILGCPGNSATGQLGLHSNSRCVRCITISHNGNSVVSTAEDGGCSSHKTFSMILAHPSSVVHVACRPELCMLYDAAITQYVWQCNHCWWTCSCRCQRVAG